MGRVRILGWLRKRGVTFPNAPKNATLIQAFVSHSDFNPEWIKGANLTTRKGQNRFLKSLGKLSDAPREDSHSTVARINGRFQRVVWKDGKTLSIKPIYPKKKPRKVLQVTEGLPKIKIPKTEERHKRFITKSGDAFFDSDEWKALRYRVLLHYGRKCMCCGATPSDGKKMHVDHIKPRSKFPELALDFYNLQVLCEDCNLGKSAKDQTDFRGLTVVS